MRLLLIIAAFVFAPIICLGQKQKRIYLKDIGKGDDREVVYIENDRHAKEYGWIANYNAGDEERDYNDGLKEIKGKNRKPLAKFDLKGLPKKWCSLRFYKGKYYVYKPADFCDNYTIRITDSTYSDVGCELTASVLLSFNKVDDQTYKFSRKWVNGNILKTAIHIIDKQKGIAIFEDISRGNKAAPEYWLMIKPENIRLFPIIISDCKSSKTVEWDFDKPDFKKLIAGTLKIN